MQDPPPPPPSTASSTTPSPSSHETREPPNSISGGNEEALKDTEDKHTRILFASHLSNCRSPTQRYVGETNNQVGNRLITVLLKVISENIRETINIGGGGSKVVSKSGQKWMTIHVGQISVQLVRDFHAGSYLIREPSPLLGSTFFTGTFTLLRGIWIE
jgi:hypothetical protein